MWKKMIQELSGKNCEFGERMFRTVIMAGGLATIIGIIEIPLVMEIDAMIVAMLFLLLLAMGICLFATFRYSRYDIAAVVLGLIIIAVIFPVMFMLSAGLNGGAAVWMALGFAYIFIMFTGKRLIFFLVLCVTAYGGTYLLALHFPEYIVPMASEELAYLDSYFSVIVVGFLIGIILKTQMKIFEKEHKLNVEQKEALERSSNTKNAFFANMSHEIRTPISTIIGLNEMIMREHTSDATREYAQDIELASKMLLNQINDILDLSQLEMQKMSIVPVQYRTKELFGELVDMIRIRMKKKKLELYLDIDRNLPSVLLGDERRLKQVLLNILDNAVKYTEEGSVTLSAHAEKCSEEEIMLQIKIADTGVGIRQEDLAHIYDAFRRVDEKDHSRIVGSGLGLAITKQLLDLMNGEIAVDSIYTKGSEFTVTLKQKVVDAEAIGDINLLEKDMAEGTPYQASFEAPEAKILVVDDNAVNSMVVSRLLTDTKVKVDTANSGFECLEMTKKKYYNVILMDHMMSKMDGVETLKAIRTQENGLCRETVVIALTANALSGAEEMYREQGFDSYLEKPIHGKVLETELLKFLPPDLIEYQAVTDTAPGGNSLIQNIAGRRRKKVCITTDCVCDIPSELLEKYDIEMMYLYIKTPQGRFADTKEIDSDSLAEYISFTNSTAYVDSVTVEEYEEFFADVLTRAEQVIHISMASQVGISYHIAMTAAKGFDHVRVIDSCQISCGQSLLSLYAAKLAKDGKTSNEICELVEKMKTRIQSKFILPSVDIFYQNGRVNAVTATACRLLQLHPYAGMRQKKVALFALLGGTLEMAWKSGIYWHLHSGRKIDRSVVFISHVGCSVEQLEWVRKEVLKYVPFERVIIQKASFSVACNSGLGTIGISYYSI
ncbi:MAG: DegV family protein [Lachnospiraceae bacterium]